MVQRMERALFGRQQFGGRERARSSRLLNSSAGSTALAAVAMK